MQLARNFGIEFIDWDRWRRKREGKGKCKYYFYWNRLNVISKRDGAVCRICAFPITDPKANVYLEVDHIIPLSEWGLSKQYNYQILCNRCNVKKGRKILKLRGGFQFDIYNKQVQKRKKTIR